MANVSSDPVITSDGGGATASVSVAENTIAVTTVTATDPDLGSSVSYSIVGGTDAALFQIDASTGVLSFVAPPDFEAPADADANNIYDVIVQASDGSLSDTQAIAVTVSDVYEPVRRVGSEILVNTATAANQFAQVVTPLANGGFVVSWTDTSQGVDTSGEAVKAQVFASDGSKVGSELLVNTATVGGQSQSTVTSLANGGFVVTWSDGSVGVGGATGDTSGSAIKMQVFSAAGVKVGSEVLVNTATAGTQDQHEVTLLSNGGFVITWRDYSYGVGGAAGDTTGAAVKAQVFAADGSRVGSEILVNTTTASDQFNATVASLDNGGFVVTWSDSGSASVKAQVFAADGGRIGTEISVNTSGGAWQEKISAFKAGGFVIAWESGDEIKAQVFAADGSKLGSEIAVNTATAGIQQDVKVQTLSNGYFVVAWRDSSLGVGGASGDTSGTAVKAQIFTPDGIKYGSEILVNTATDGYQYAAQITALNNGAFVITWADASEGVGGAAGDTSGRAIKAQAFEADGSRIGTEFLVNTATAGFQTEPYIKTLSNGDFVIIWQDGQVYQFSGSLGVGGATGDTSGSAVKAQVYTITIPNEAPVITSDGGGATASVWWPRTQLR